MGSPCLLWVVVATSTLLSRIVSADFDGGVVTAVQEGLECGFSRPATQLTLVKNLFATGVLAYNHSNASNVEMRQYFYGDVSVATDEVAWTGAGFSDGSSLWWFRPNTTYASVPDVYQGIRISPFAYEGGGQGADWGCPKTSFTNELTGSALQEWWAPMHDPTTPSFLVACWPYDPRQRPWYKLATNGSIWSTSPYTWLDLPYISVNVRLTNTEDEFIGVGTISYGTHRLEHKLSAIVGNNFAFVMEREGDHLLVFDSQSKSYNHTLSAQVPVLQCNSEKIRTSARDLIDHGFPDNSSVSFPFITRDRNYYIFAYVVSELGGIAMPNEWVVVTAQEIMCKEGSYVDSSFSCQICPSPKTSSGRGVVSCDLCEAGYYKTAAGDCSRCPDNAICRGGTAVPYPKPGFWMDISDLNYLHEARCCAGYDSKCDVDSNCNGGAAIFDICFQSEAHLLNCSKDALCQEGSTGFLCRSCKEDHYMSLDNICAPCKRTTVSVVLGAIFLGILCTILVSALFNQFGAGAIHGLLRLRCRKYYHLIFDMAKFKILWSVLQIISSVDWILNINFPEPFASFQHHISMLTQLSLNNLLPMSCFMQYSFQEHLLFSCLAPIALSMVLGLSIALKLGLLYNRGKSNISPETAKELEVQRRSMIDATTWLFLFLTFIVLPTTSAVIFRTFQCEKFPSGESYLAADLSMSCESHRYLGCRLFAYSMVVICKNLNRHC